MNKLLAVLLGLGLVLGASLPRAAAQTQDDKKQADKDKKKDNKKKSKSGEDEPLPDPKDSEKQLTRLSRDLQYALESGSHRQFLGFLNDAKFDDYPHFEDTIERLMREDSIRANFRSAFSTPPSGQGKAQMAIDVDMELARKDGVGQLVRRKQQLVIDWEYTRRGWKIVNITPRAFFNP
jgi:hypothetical protein